MWKRLVAVVLCSAFLASSRAAADVITVVPSGQAASEGNSDNGYPFNIAHFGLSTQRYQQVYLASQFPSGPQLITQIAFRPDATFGSAFSSTLPNVQIDLSTTSAAPGSLSSTYASNVGGNDAVVFSGALSLSSSDTGPAGGPKAFDIVINLTTPFLYDPSAGNLLLDVRNFGGGLTTQFDAEAGSADTSRIFTNSGVGASTGTFDNSGLVTQFTSAPVATPEPASLTLFGMMGLVGAGFAALRRRRMA